MRTHGFFVANFTSETLCHSVKLHKWSSTCRPIYKFCCRYNWSDATAALFSIRPTSHTLMEASSSSFMYALDDVFRRCLYRGKDINCTDLFYPVYTGSGNSLSFFFLINDRNLPEHASAL